MEENTSANKRLNLKPKEACDIIGCSEYKIKELARQGKIPHHRIGNRIMFTREGLEEWIMQMEKKAWVRL